MTKLDEFQEKLSDSKANELNRIAASIPAFILNQKNSKLSNVELYNRWLNEANIIPSDDTIAIWTYLFLSNYRNNMPSYLIEEIIQAKQNSTMERNTDYD